MDDTKAITFGEYERLHPGKFDIFTPTVKEYDTPGRYSVLLPGPMGENETVEIQVYENGCYTILEEEESIPTDKHITTDK